MCWVCWVCEWLSAHIWTLTHSVYPQRSVISPSLRLLETGVFGVFHAFGGIVTDPTHSSSTSSAAGSMYGCSKVDMLLILMPKWTCLSMLIITYNTHGLLRQWPIPRMHTSHRCTAIYIFRITTIWGGPGTADRDKHSGHFVNTLGYPVMIFLCANLIPFISLSFHITHGPFTCSWRRTGYGHFRSGDLHTYILTAAT